MADDQVRDFDDMNSDDFNADGMHFSEEELEAAMAGFEKEFNESLEDRSSDDSQPESSGRESSDIDKMLDEAENSLKFEDELQGLLGNRAKMAVTITRLTSARLLAAFCELSDISAQCIDSAQGAVAVLRNLDGDGPEAAVKDMTIVVSGMPAILAVNRADKLEATMYMEGRPGRTFAPPVLFTSTASFVEDLLLGITDMKALVDSGVNVVDSADLSRDEAMEILAEHTRFGRGGGAVE